MEIDYTQIIIALIVVFGPSILRELRQFYIEWRIGKPDIAWKLEQAAGFGVKAAQTMKESGIWTEEKGKAAENYAVITAESFLLRQGIKVDFALILDTVRAVWQDSDFKPKS